jgi:hypothetical protein
MNTFSSILLAAALASIGTGALAADDALKVLSRQAKETYKMDKESCKSLKGDEHERCMHRARAQYDQEVAQIRADRKAYKDQDKAARAEAKQARRAKKARSDASHDESSAGTSGLPMPGSQSSLSQPTADYPPLSSMGKAPVSANSPYTGDPKKDRPPR